MADLNSGADNRPTEIEKKVVPYGDNPYFPAETSPQQEETEVPTEDTQVAADEATQEAGEPEGEQRQDQEPTFDIDTDRANGIDVDDPNYKHYQAAFTKGRQRDKDTLDSRIAQLEKQAQLKKVTAETQEDVSSTPEFLSVSWTDFQAPSVDAESALSGVESEIGGLVQKYIDHAIKDIGGQQQVAIQQYQAQQATDAITQFIGRLDPNKATEAIGLLEEYKEFAKTSPDKWIKFAEKTLEPAPKAPPTPPDPRKLVDKQRAATQPPSNSTTTTSQKPVFTNTKDAVKWAMDQQ